VAGSSLLMLIDDIATLLDDVAVLSKVAAKKTAGVLGDDLALNAEQVAGVHADRELPVVFAVAKGSAVNKLILVPLALLISAVAHWAITIALMLGGSFLAYEGAEKVLHIFHKKKAEGSTPHPVTVAAANPAVDMVEFERKKVRGAIRTDLILSAEIIVITLGTVSEAPFSRQVGVLCLVAVAMTVGVYGFVAAIVKLDDAGLALMKRPSAAAKALGRALVASTPYLMRGLGIAGTIAMFLVGGGILAHGIPAIEHAIASIAASTGPLAGVVPTILHGLLGVVVGVLIVGIVTLVSRLRGRAEA
jgi:predicted DNA repair protein MutK